MYAPAEPRIVQVYPVRRRFSGVTPAILGEGVARGKGVKPFPTCLLSAVPNLSSVMQHGIFGRERPSHLLFKLILS